MFQNTYHGTKIDLKQEDLKLPKQLKMLILGPSNSGKSTRILEIIKNKEKICAGNITKICYISPNLSSPSKKDRHFHAELGKYNVFCQDSLPTEENIHDSFIPLEGQRTLLIIDDFSSQVFNDNNIRDIFERMSNHCDLDVILTSQSPFKSRQNYFQDIVRSASVVCIMNSLLDKKVILNLSIKFGLKKTIDNALKQAVKIYGPRAHIFIFSSYDSHLSSLYPVRTGYFSCDNPLLNYRPLFFKTLD